MKFAKLLILILPLQIQSTIALVSDQEGQSERSIRCTGSNSNEAGVEQAIELSLSKTPAVVSNTLMESFHVPNDAFLLVQEFLGVFNLIVLNGSRNYFSLVGDSQQIGNSYEINGTLELTGSDDRIIPFENVRCIYKK